MKQYNNLTPVPHTLLPETVTERLKHNGGIAKLNELADRGIILNTWQANQLLLDGDRQNGKTYLSYVRVAESNKNNGCVLRIEDTLTVYDPDVTTIRRRQEWLRGLVVFINTYYSDIYMIEDNCSNAVKLVLKKKQPKRWWL